MDEISAGETEGRGINYSGLLNDTLLFDYPMSNLSRLIDLNDDGINDFELKFVGSVSASHTTINNTITAIGNSYFSFSEPDSNSVDTLVLNNTINADLHWQNESGMLYFEYNVYLQPYSQGGLWKNAVNKYIGVKINVDDKILFGWIRIETTNGWNNILVDYACTVEYL